MTYSSLFSSAGMNANIEGFNRISIYPTSSSSSLLPMEQNTIYLIGTPLTLTPRTYDGMVVASVSANFCQLSNEEMRINDHFALKRNQVPGFQKQMVDTIIQRNIQKRDSGIITTLDTRQDLNAYPPLPLNTPAQLRNQANYQSLSSFFSPPSGLLSSQMNPPTLGTSSAQGNNSQLGLSYPSTNQTRAPSFPTNSSLLSTLPPPPSLGPIMQPGLPPLPGSMRGPGLNSAQTNQGNNSQSNNILGASTFAPLGASNSPIMQHSSSSLLPQPFQSPPRLGSSTFTPSPYGGMLPMSPYMQPGLMGGPSLNTNMMMNRMAPPTYGYNYHPNLSQPGGLNQQLPQLSQLSQLPQLPAFYGSNFDQYYAPNFQHLHPAFAGVDNKCSPPPLPSSDSLNNKTQAEPSQSSSETQTNNLQDQQNSTDNNTVAGSEPSADTNEASVTRNNNQTTSNKENNQTETKVSEGEAKQTNVEDGQDCKRRDCATNTETGPQTVASKPGAFFHEINKLLFVSHFADLLRKHSMVLPDNILDSTDFIPEFLGFLENFGVRLPQTNVPKFKVHNQPVFSLSYSEPSPPEDQTNKEEEKKQEQEQDQKQKQEQEQEQEQEERQEEVQAQLQEKQESQSEPQVAQSETESQPHQRKEEESKIQEAKQTEENKLEAKKDPATVLVGFIDTVVKDASANSQQENRKTITAIDIVSALRKNGKNLYGFNK